MPNDQKFKKITGSICAPLGFQAAAVFCGIKKVGTGKGSDKGPKGDLGMIVSDLPAAVAGMFTTNRVSAAPVKLSAKCAAGKNARVIVVNSGNANACTGTQGMRDAKKMANVTASVVAAIYLSRRSDAKADDGRIAAQPSRLRSNLVRKLEACATFSATKDRRGIRAPTSAVADRRYSKITPNDVLVCSTGRIGISMPMRNVVKGIRACGPFLARSSRSAGDVAEAIMTSDTRRKQVAVEVEINGKPVRVGGICKGAGMIQPRMIVATAPRHCAATLRYSGAATKHATMLAFITSDVAIAPDLLKRALAEAVEQSFNRITVDGDTSTNDSVIALANGLAGNPTIAKRGSAFEAFQAAVAFVCLELAKMIVRDGEGVSRFVAVRVHNAKSPADAEIAARAIANSSLVRTSWCGGDPNWGRILCALGYSGATIDESRTDIGYSAAGKRNVLYGFRRGAPTNVSLAKLARITIAREFDVHVDLHHGRAEFAFYASDLTEEYVAFNKGDVSDPASLGG